MKVLFAALKYDYGRPQNGLSVEYTNFYDALKHIQGVEADFFAIDEETAKLGYDEANKLLVQMVRETNPISDVLAQDKQRALECN